MERYVCIHGHFYQPPRENPWLEVIELQDSAYPYHDWNERINAECYEPNSASRILDKENRIIEIVNNYARISFNFGPTLLAWLQNNAPDVYQLILKADKDSQNLFSGHGSALAQVYNHLIMPLANRRDKYTQVWWSLRDFESRFGRQAEGMWLPETAVDLETLEILAESGVKFTVLAPHQAGKVRQIGAANWDDVSGSRIDPTMAYELNLASGRKINLFFYDGPISRSVAFEGLLENGENFANRLIGAFSKHGKHPQIVHIATDGESYGHHHRYGEMALSYALSKVEDKPQTRLTNYAEFLAKNPSTHEVEIIENTSWSCSHGIERWWKDCGCNSGGHPGWNQAWRTPLREAMDWLRDSLVPRYEEKARQLLKDPWTARNDYITVVLDRSPKNVGKFLNEHAAHPLGKPERITALKLLELQRHAMLMYTSCGWFFDELSGIETVQVIQYAGRVVQLAEELFGNGTEQQFLKLLEAAKSNLPQFGNGRNIYDMFVKPAMIDLTDVAAHYAVSSLFEDYSGQINQVFCYNIRQYDYKREDCGKQRAAVGRVNVASAITHESKVLSFGEVHFGDHNLNAGVRDYRGKEAYQEMLQEITTTCSAADFPGVIRLLDKHFGTSTYSLKSLFRDEQRKVVNNILVSSLDEVQSEYRKVYQSNYPLMRFLVDLGISLPGSLKAAAELILNTDLRNALTAETPNQETVTKLLNDANSWNVGLDNEGLSHVFRQALEKRMADLAARPEDDVLLDRILASVEIARSLPFKVELRGVQNDYYRMLQTVYADFEDKAKAEDEAAKEWLTRFVSLGTKLSIYIA
jgi:alpha-amylase/alpha-mannosidase (GH57 family)